MPAETEYNPLTTVPVPVSQGGTGATTAAGARTSLGAAASGSNSDITALTGLTSIPSILTSINTVFLKDQFIGGGSASTSLGTTGELGWSVLQITGGSVSDYTAATAGHWGVYRVGAGTSSANGSALVLQYGGSFSTANRIPPLNAITGWNVQFYVALSAATTIQFECGFEDDNFNTATKPTNGIYWQFDTNALDANFSAVCRAASTETKTASAVAGDTNYHRLGIRSEVAGTIIFSIDGVDTSIATNVPSAAMTPFVRCVTRTNGTRTVDVDTFVLYYLIP